MDLKKFGLEELTHEEATNIDGGGPFVAGLVAAGAFIPLLFGPMTFPLYVSAIFAGLAVPIA